MLRDNARDLRKKMTEAERELRSLLRRKQIENHRFRKQVPIGRYIVDFACLDARLVIEVDGGQHSDAVQADEVRDAWLRSQNFRILRFWNNDILKNPEGVMQAIGMALEVKP